MAEEVQYASGGDSATNKRKYADQSDTPALPSFGGRRTTGFSSGPISSQSPDSAPSYNSVAPPADDIQIAKQKAQEIAARLLNTVEAKRPRVENGGYDYTDAKGFNSGPTGSTSTSLIIV